MTRELDSPGTRIRAAAAYALATLARLAAIALALPAGLALIQSIGRVITGEFVIPRGTWAFDLLYIYILVTQRMFESVSPRYFNELDPTIQGLLVFIPNLALVILGLWSLIHIVRPVVKR
jgi:hypothetical protein